MMRTMPEINTVMIFFGELFGSHLNKLKICHTTINNQFSLVVWHFDLCVMRCCGHCGHSNMEWNEIIHRPLCYETIRFGGLSKWVGIGAGLINWRRLELTFEAIFAKDRYHPSHMQHAGQGVPHLHPHQMPTIYGKPPPSKQEREMRFGPVTNDTS